MTITLLDLRPYPLVCLPEGTGIRAVFDEACQAQGFRPAVALQASAPGAVADLALRGLGVAILSESMAAGSDQLRSLLIADVETRAVLALIWTGSASPALGELLVQCRRSFIDPPT